MFQYIQKLDTTVLDFIRSHFHSPLLDIIMPIITSLGNTGLVWIGISVILLIGKKHRKAGVMVICSLILVTILGEGIIKHLVQRPRPCADIPASQLLIRKPLDFSFPSGHTASAFAAAGILLREFRQYRVYIIVLASLIAFSRMYLYVHYPTDIIGGIVLSLLCAWLVWISGKKHGMPGEH